MKRRGGHVTAVDRARYATVFAESTSAPTPTALDLDALDAELADLDALDGRARLLHRDVLPRRPATSGPRTVRASTRSATRSSGAAAHPLYPVLLTSLIEAADRVDSTVGVQMAYLKQWAPRAHQRLTLRVPELLAGPGRGDPRRRGRAASPALGAYDLAYLDPPYNQHRY